jgi:hypothetical protein
MWFIRASGAPGAGRRARNANLHEHVRHANDGMEYYYPAFIELFIFLKEPPVVV